MALVTPRACYWALRARAEGGEGRGEGSFPILVRHARGRPGLQSGGRAGVVGPSGAGVVLVASWREGSTSTSTYRAARRLVLPRTELVTQFGLAMPRHREDVDPSNSLASVCRRAPLCAPWPAGAQWGTVGHSSGAQPTSAVHVQTHCHE